MRACAWGLAKLSPSPPVASPCRLRPGVPQQASDIWVPVKGMWQPRPPFPAPPPPASQPLRRGDSPGPAGTYWIFLVKFLETIPPSTCCSSCLPAGKGNTPRHHLTGRLFFSPTNNNKTQQESLQRSRLPLPVQTLPSGESSGSEEGDAGHSTPIFPARAWGLAARQELGLKKKSPKVIKPLEVAAFPLVPLLWLGSPPPCCQAGGPCAWSISEVKNHTSSCLDPPDLCFPPLVMP